MARVHTIKVEPLTQESFSSFGQVIQTGGREPDLRGASGMQMWGLDFHVEGTIQLALVHVPFQGLGLKPIEQHHDVSQAFIPMGGPPSVVAVAASTGPDSAPRPGDIRAFLLDGTQGYILNVDTWHSLDRLPVCPPGADWIILTEKETSDDIIANGMEGAHLTRLVNFEDQSGVTLELTL